MVGAHSPLRRSNAGRQRPVARWAFPVVQETIPSTSTPGSRPPARDQRGRLDDCANMSSDSGEIDDAGGILSSGSGRRWITAASRTGLVGRSR